MSPLQDALLSIVSDLEESLVHAAALEKALIERRLLAEGEVDNYLASQAEVHPEYGPPQ